MKNKLLLTFILASVVIDFTGLYIVVGTLRSIYHKEMIQGDYTKYMGLLDSLNSKLGNIPILFWVSLGIAIGIIVMSVWIWVGFEKK